MLRGAVAAAGDGGAMNWQPLNNLIFGENSRQRNRREHADAIYKGAWRSSTQSFAVPSGGRVFGIDVSPIWDGLVDMQAVKASGASFVCIKVCDGTIESKGWVENATRAALAGLIYGYYCWLYPDSKVSCKAQAAAVWNLIKADPGNIPITVDFEWTKFLGQQANPNYTDLEKFVDEFTRLSGIRPGLYTAAGYMNQFGTMPARLRLKLDFTWIANYGVLAPQMPLGFVAKAWDFWQFGSGDASIYGPNNAGKLETDLDYWNGSLPSLMDFANISEAPPQTGEPMEQVIQGTAKGTVTRRDAAAGNSFSPPRYLKLGDTIEADKRDTVLPQWLHLTKINGVTIASEEWASAGTQQQYIGWQWVDAPPVVPPVTPADKAPFTLTVDGFLPFTGELEKA